MPTNSDSWSTKTYEIILYRKKNPCLDMQAIADHFTKLYSKPISRERIRQILSRAGERTTSIKYRSGRTCSRCGKPKTPTSSYCRDCFYDLHRVTLICANPLCGTLFEKYQSYVLRGIRKHDQELFFCSKHCQGMWLAINYGWGAPLTPEEKVRRKEEQKIKSLAYYYSHKNDPDYIKRRKNAIQKYAEKRKKRKEVMINGRGV